MVSVMSPLHPLINYKNIAKIQPVTFFGGHSVFVSVDRPVTFPKFYKYPEPGNEPVNRLINGIMN